MALTGSDVFLEVQLPFDSNWLLCLDSMLMFMDNAEILQWIDSVAHPFLKLWHDESMDWSDNACLSPRVDKIRTNTSDFVREVMEIIRMQHSLVASIGGNGGCDDFPDLSPSAWEDRMSWTFEEFTAFTACLIVRHGNHCDWFGGPREQEEGDEEHFHATMLLVAVTMDLVDGTYFANLLRSPVSASENNEDEMELDAFDDDAAAESLTHRLQDLSVTADAVGTSDTAFSNSVEA